MPDTPLETSKVRPMTPQALFVIAALRRLSEVGDDCRSRSPKERERDGYR